MKATPKKFMLLLNFAVIIFALPILLLILDPFTHYKRNFNTEKPVFQNSMRMYHNALIEKLYCRNTSYEVITMGASIAQNYEPQLIAQAFGVQKAINLSFSGATPLEQSYIINKALACRAPAHVFWSIGPAWDTAPDRNHPAILFPEYLHNKNPLDDFNYLYDYKTGLKSIYYVVNEFFGEGVSKFLRIRDWKLVPLSRISAWTDFTQESLEADNQLFLERQSLLANSSSISLIEQALQKSAAKTMDENALSESTLIAQIVKSNHDVKFSFLLPPTFIKGRSSQSLAREIIRTEYLTTLAAKHKNVDLYAFPNPKIVSNPKNYKDSMHFDVSISRYILNQIRQGNGKLTKESLNSYLASFYAQLSASDNDVKHWAKFADIDGTPLE